MWQSDDTAGTSAKAGGKIGGTRDLEGDSGNTDHSSQKAVYTGMSVEPGGVLHGSWGKIAWDSTYTGTNAGKGELRYNWYDAQAETDIHYGNRATMVYNDISALGLTPDDTGESNGLKVWDSSASNSGQVGTGSYYWVERVWRNTSDHVLDRYQNPRIVTDGDYIHVSYYDRVTGSIKYWFNKSGTNQSRSYYDDDRYVMVDSEQIPGKRWISLDGGWEDEDWKPVSIGSGIDSDVSNTELYNVQAGITTGGGASNSENNRLIKTSKSVGAWINKNEAFMEIGSSSAVYYTPRARRSGFITAIRTGKSVSESTAYGLVKIQTFRLLNVSFPGSAAADSKTLTANQDRTGNAGMYNAIDVNSDGYPVIAYFDGTNQKLKIAYAKKRMAVDITDWAVQTVTEAGDFAGQFVTMRIDNKSAGINKDRIHIAFLRSNTNELVYVSGSRNGDSGYHNFTSVNVDSSGSVGRWADISLDANGNPWITYLDNPKASAGSYDGMKAAYLPGAGAGDTTEWKIPANWETMHIPVRYRTSNKRVHIEAAPGGAVSPNNFWNAAVGYESNDYFRIAYFVK
jgi:hypothetical protein